MKKIKLALLSIFCLSILQPAFSQSPAVVVTSAPTLEMHQIAQNKIQSVIKLIGNENLLNTIDIKKYQETLTNATSSFYDALKVVSQNVLNAQAVKQTIDIQKQYMATYFEKTVSIGNRLKGNDRQTFMILQNAGLKQSFDKVSALKVMLTANYYTMNDNERLSHIAGIKNDLQLFYQGMLSYCKEVESAIAIEQANKPKTLAEMKQIYN